MARGVLRVVAYQMLGLMVLDLGSDEPTGKQFEMKTRYSQGCSHRPVLEKGYEVLKPKTVATTVPKKGPAISCLCIPLFAEEEIQTLLVQHRAAAVFS